MKKLFTKDITQYHNYYYFFNHRISIHVSKGDPWGRNNSTSLVIGRTFKKGRHFRLTFETWYSKTDEPPF